jgi:hypothetical protein
MQRTLSMLAILLSTIGLAPMAAGALPPEQQFAQRIAETKSSMMSDPEAALANARAAGALTKSLPAGKAAIARATSEWQDR